jgi:hypothetical protein
MTADPTASPSGAEPRAFVLLKSRRGLDGVVTLTDQGARGSDLGCTNGLIMPRSGLCRMASAGGRLSGHQPCGCSA